MGVQPSHCGKPAVGYREEYKAQEVNKAFFRPRLPGVWQSGELHD